MDSKPVYIFDLDGTLANCTHRLHYLDSDSDSKWDDFYAMCENDTPIDAAIITMNGLIHAGAYIYIFTGRSITVEKQTTEWLERWTRFNTERHCLLMRPEGNHTPDYVLKREWYSKLLPVDRKNLIAVFEDRTQCVNMWRELGVTCFQVADGDF